MEDLEYILKILKEVQRALKKRDYIKIKNLSNKVIHSASITQKSEIILIAVLVYSLSKILEREDYKSYDNWDSFYKNYIGFLESSIIELENGNFSRFYDYLELMRKSINQLSGKLKFYIQDIFRRAKINKASRIYEHGISMGKTASILGISVWELSEYIGQSGIHDVNLAVTLPLKQRIKLVEDIFK